MDQRFVDNPLYGILAIELSMNNPLELFKI